jgi:hypothetical protein
MPVYPCDEHTLFEALEQVAILIDCQPKLVALWSKLQLRVHNRNVFPVHDQQANGMVLAFPVWGGLLTVMGSSMVVCADCYDITDIIGAPTI